MSAPKYPAAVFVCHDVFGNAVDCYDSLDAAQETGSRTIRRYVDGLSHEDLVAACRNIGFDLTCAACAAIFYAGFGLPHDEHDAGCSGRRGACLACDVDEAAPGVDYGRTHTCKEARR